MDNPQVVPDNLTVNFRRFNPFRLFNSVPFGIGLMVLCAGFIALGSARPFLREMGIDEWPGFRDWFDKTDLQFFNAWPLVTLMVLLVVNLVVVTWRRIPLTPPRYGVWCVHAGIITLIFGTMFYYHNKLEGRIRIFTDPSIGATTVDHYYDKDERSLYIRCDTADLQPIPLPQLPRFKEYDESIGNAGRLARRGLTGLVPSMQDADQNGKLVTRPLAEIFGWKQKLSLDVIGFFPYARVNTDFVPDPNSKTTALELTFADPKSGQVTGDWWLAGGDPRFATNDSLGMLLEHHHETDPTVYHGVIDSVPRLFQLNVHLPGFATAEHPQILNVQLGQSYPLGETGYVLSIEKYNPDWSMFGTGERATLLTLLVKSPTQTFRRMVIDGKPTQTDFKLSGPGAGRQKAPLDKDLVLDFHVNDPFFLLPQAGSGVKHTFFTLEGDKAVTEISTGLSTPAVVTTLATGSGMVQLDMPAENEDAPFLAAMAAQSGAAGGDAEHPGATSQPAHPAVALHVDRRDHVSAVDSVSAVPLESRDSSHEETGQDQCVKVRVTLGGWSTVVVVPFSEEALESPWQGGTVTLPGGLPPLQLQLGNTVRPLPAKLTLDSFKVVPYAGASEKNPGAMMSDFKSTITVTDRATGDSFTDVANMNHPIYFDSGRWLFFQAAWDPEAQRWTQLGVGNRPGVMVMISGAIMIFSGLAYAFYIKPIIVKKMKEKAIQEAIKRGRTPAVPVQELVESGR